MAAALRITPAQAESIARRHYGVHGSAQRLASEHDDTFRVVAGDGSSRVEQRLGRELDGTDLRGELTGCLDHFAESVRPRLAGAAVQVIHNDFHGENLLSDGTRIAGILDFGDALTGPVAMDVGVAACYQLGSGPARAGASSDEAASVLLAPAGDVIAGYHAIDPLTAADLALAAEFIVARVAARIIVSQWNAVREPANRPYLLRRTPQAVGQLLALRRTAPRPPGSPPSRPRSASCAASPGSAGSPDKRHRRRRAGSAVGDGRGLTAAIPPWPA